MRLSRRSTALVTAVTAVAIVGAVTTTRAFADEAPPKKPGVTATPEPPVEAQPTASPAPPKIKPSASTKPTAAPATPPKVKPSASIKVKPTATPAAPPKVKPATTPKPVAGPAKVTSQPRTPSRR